MISIYKYFSHNYYIHSLLFAIALTIPVYIISFFGMHPIVQGCAYLSYAVIFFYFWYQSKKLFFGKKFVFYWIVFLHAWIIPSIINAYSRDLESDLVNLPVLFVHSTYMSMLFFSFGMYFTLNGRDSYKKLLQYISLLLIPLLISLFFYAFSHKTEYFSISFLSSSIGSHFIGEVLLVSTFGILFISTKWEKIILFLLALLFFIFLDIRVGILAFIIFLFINFCVFLAQIKKRIIYLIIFLCFTFFYFFYDNIYQYLNKYIFYFESGYRGFESGFTSRYYPWLRAYDSICENIWHGVGFWVKPYGYELVHSLQPGFNLYAYNNPEYEIHNAWIRILTENGIILFLIIFLTIIISIFRCIQRHDWFILSIILCITFYLCFVTRHLTLNLMNVILYLMIFMTFYNKKTTL